MKIHYPDAIAEATPHLLRLEEMLRGEAACDRVRMLRMLKSGQCANQTAVARTLGYSTRQIRRWWQTYREAGIESLITQPERGGSTERATPAALEALRLLVLIGRLNTLREVQEYLEYAHGIEYQSRQGVLDLMRRHGITFPVAPAFTPPLNPDI